LLLQPDALFYGKLIEDFGGALPVNLAQRTRIPLITGRRRRSVPALRSAVRGRLFRRLRGDH
jgi:hypothetical protein